MDKLHFVHAEFNALWQFFKNYNPTTEAEWEKAMEAADKFTKDITKQDKALGKMFEKMTLAVIDYKEGEREIQKS